MIYFCQRTWNHWDHTKKLPRIIQRLFNSIIHQGKTPEAWYTSVVVLLFQKGDNNMLKNSRPISLLSHVYQLFLRVIPNHPVNRFDNFQPPEQASFRKGFSIIDYLHTLRQARPKNITVHFF
ncbi:jg1513 [Pararge aegeria aegeria]|uniref:Jg1513 protein n=1 Tax=Pararge aegeria aegeria TaxID=348720 RepID=A0A8S4RZL4_9NEOP|nr:jg1513 [Pararge aegeria aegeria]